MTQFKAYNILHDAVTETEYRALVAAIPDATLFNDWPWLVTWEQFAEVNERLFIVGRNSRGQLISFIGLGIGYEKQFGIRTRVARLTQSPWADRVGILLHPEYLKQWPSVLDFLQQTQRSRWDLMVWEQVQDHNGLIKYALDNDHWLHSLRTCQCPVFYLKNLDRHAIVSSYPSKMRTDLKRRRKKLAQLNAELIHIRPTEQQTDALVRQIRDVESQSWKAEEDVGIFNHPTAGPFFSAVASQLAREGKLDLALVYIDGELASYKFGFYFRNTFFDYSIGYLPKYSKLALGRLLLDEIVLSAADQQYHAIDASRVGAQTQHLLLERTTNTIDHWRLYFFSKNVKGLLLRFLITWLKPVAKHSRQRWRKLRRQKFSWT